MKNAFIPYGEYEIIINLLGQWKILNINELNIKMNNLIKYSNLTKKIRFLENLGIIKSVNIGKNIKHIYLSNKGLQYTPFDNSYEISEDNLNHDLTVSNTLKTLLKYKCFKNGKMFHQITQDEIYPDAMLEGIKDEMSYKLALEIELTQKSQQRVKEKFIKYSNSKFFDYALFLTPKDSLSKAYKNFLKNMSEEIQETIIISHDENLGPLNSNFEKAKCYYMNEEVSFSDVFGIKELNTSEMPVKTCKNIISAPAING